MPVKYWTIAFNCTNKDSLLWQYSDTPMGLPFYQAFVRIFVYFCPSVCSTTPPTVLHLYV